MVTTYFDDDEPTLRRYSRGRGYQLSHGRDLSTGPYDAGARDRSISTHETRCGNRPPEPDNNSRPRSRIPVACGRCRKRKIRCSGDLGTGLPCTNCKGAGVETCQFLRVSSTEAQMKSDPFDFNGFEPPPVPPRLQCRIVPYGAPTGYIPPAPVSTEGYYPRNNPVSSYQYPQNRYYGGPPYGEFADDSVDYGLQGASFSLLGCEQLLSPSFPSASNRGWAPPPLLPRSDPVSPVYLEQDPAYNHGQVSYPTAYPLRQPLSPEARSSSLCGQTANNSVPPPVSGTDRVLPIPATNRPAQMGSYLRSNNSLPAASYLPYSSSNPESLPTSQPAYSPPSISQQQSEMYNSNNENLFQANESSESSYGPSSGDKRSSVSSHSNTAPDGPIPPLSNNNLANGHAYIPYHHLPSYPAPPPATPASSALPIPPRRISPGISTA